MHEISILNPVISKSTKIIYEKDPRCDIEEV